MEEQHERMNPINPKGQLMRSKNGPGGRPVMGAGATPSMGLSQFRGGKTAAEKERERRAAVATLAEMAAGITVRRDDDFVVQLIHRYRTLHPEVTDATYLQILLERGFTEPRARDIIRRATLEARAPTSLLNLRNAQNDGSLDGSGRARTEAHRMGEALSKHIHDLHGAGFWSDFGNGFKKGFTGTLDFLSPAIEKAVPGFSKHYETGKKILGFGASESQRAATMLGMKKKGRSRNNGPALLSGNVDGVFSGGSHDSDSECEGGANTGAYEGHGSMVGGRKPNARAAIVKKVMAEKGMKMIEASKYVKEHGLY